MILMPSDQNRQEDRDGSITLFILSIVIFTFVRHKVHKHSENAQKAHMICKMTNVQNNAKVSTLLVKVFWTLDYTQMIWIDIVLLCDIFTVCIISLHTPRNNFSNKTRSYHHWFYVCRYTYWTFSYQRTPFNIWCAALFVQVLFVQIILLQ